jgi:ribonuclease HI
MSVLETRRPIQGSHNVSKIQEQQHWVKGHNGIRGKDEADRWVNEGAQKEPPYPEPN